MNQQDESPAPSAYQFDHQNPPSTIRASSSSFSNARQPAYHSSLPTVITTVSPPWFGPSVALGTMLDATWELVPRPRSRSSPSSRSLKRARLEDDQQNRFAGSRLPSQLVDQDAFFPLGTPSSADFAPLSSRRAGRVAPPRIRPPPSSSQPNLPVPLDPLGLGLNFSTRQVGSFSQPPFQQRSTSMVAPRISARRVGVGAGAGAGGGRASFEGMQEGYRTWVGDAAGRREFEQGVFRDAGFETRSSSLSSSSSWGTPQSSDSVHPLLVPPYIEGTQQDYKFPNPYVWSAPPVPTQQSHPRHQCTPNLPPDPLPAPLHQLHSRPTNLPPRRTLGTSSVGRPDSLSPPNIPLPSRRSVSAEVTRLPPCEEDEGEDPFATKETLLEVVSPPPTFSNSTTIRCPEQLCSFAALEMEVIARHLRMTHGA